MGEARKMIGAVRLEREEVLDLRDGQPRAPEPRHHLAALAGRGMRFYLRQEHRMHAERLGRVCAVRYAPSTTLSSVPAAERSARALGRYSQTSRRHSESPGRTPDAGMVPTCVKPSRRG